MHTFSEQQSQQSHIFNVKAAEQEGGAQAGNRKAILPNLKMSLQPPTVLKSS